MSVNVIIQPHPLRSSRLKISVNAKTISEILKDLNTGFPESQARVCRNGEIVKDFSELANDGDTLWIKFVPYGSSPQAAGTGMKIGGWALILAGLVCTALLGWTGIGGFLGASLIGSGLSMALGGTVLLNTSIPKFSDREKPENDPSIRGAKNQARPHGRIPVLFGRHRIYPDLAANQHTEVIGNQQYFTQLLCGGYRDCNIDRNSIKLGDIPITELSQTGDINKILAGDDPVISLEILQNGEASKIYPWCVHEITVNAPLLNETDIGNGVKMSGAVIRTTPDETDCINVDIFFHNGLGKYNDKGDLEETEVTVTARFKPASAPDSQYQSLGMFSAGNTVKGAELKTRRLHITRRGLERGQYTVRIERTTPDSTDSNVIDIVHVGSIRAIKSERPVREIRQKELTIIALRVMATAKLSGVIGSFNYVATSRLPVHTQTGSGPLSWINSAETRNPAAMLLYALRGRAAQQIADNHDINWTSIEDFYSWCEEHKYTCNAYLSEAVTIAELLRMLGSTARADILRIDSLISVVQDIERPSHVQLFTPKNTASYSITMFNADTPDAIALRYIDEDAGFSRNELLVYNTPDGNRVKEPCSVQKTDLWGITDSVQARRIGMYYYACLKNRPFVHTIEVDIEYLLCNKGDWIQYAGDIALTGSVQGRIKGVIWADGVCIGIDTDEPVVMTEGNQYAVRIRLSDGTIILKDVVFSLGLPHEKSIPYYPVDNNNNDKLFEPSLGDMYAIDEENNIYYEPQNVIFFTEPLEVQNAPKAGNIYAFGIRGHEIIDLIITDIQPGQDLSAVLTCVEYSPEIFGVDKPGFILPDFVNRITPVSGAVDSGIVNSNNWRHFAVFHDDEEEPPRPTGDGQNDGWYNTQTVRSIWQSSKTAESIESGEWRLPVRIKAQRGTDDITPIWLSLHPQNISLDTDGNGSILAGLLPLTAQVRLLKWNSVLQGVAFSLLSAPLGVSINQSSGLITIGENAVLADNNSITVTAVYLGATYSSILNITKNTNNFPARYLGTVRELSQTAEVFILTGPVLGRVVARQGDYVLAIEVVGIRQAGSVFQWTGTGWQFRSPDTHADLYMRSLKDGLDALGDNMGWFGAVFARLLVAQRAFIEELSAQFLKVSGAIYGGNRFNADGGVANPLANGWHLGADGVLQAFNGIFRGYIEANSGHMQGGLIAGGRWNINGNVINSANSGIFIPENIAANRGACRIHSAEFTGRSWFDIRQLELWDTNEIKENSFTEVAPSNIIEGRMTLAELNTRLRTIPRLSAHGINGSAVMRAEDRMLVTGMLGILTGSPGGLTISERIVLTGIERSSLLTLHGFSLSGNSPIRTITVTGTQQVEISMTLL